MKFGQFLGKALTAGVLTVACAACSAKQEPGKWTLWYVPNEPKPGVRLAQPCHTYVFATAPVPVAYDVAVVNGWAGAHKPEGNTANMHSGESFTGPLDLGTNTIHDESNGYDVTVTVVYKIGTYLAAKARADADCPLPSGRR
jgi:hypothetical protein